MIKSARKKPVDSQQLLSDLHAGVLSGSIEIADAIKLMRRISGLTQERFAKHRGISVQALRQIESGGNPTVETLNKVSSVFGLKVGFVPIGKTSP